MVENWVLFQATHREKKIMIASNANFRNMELVLIETLLEIQRTLILCLALHISILIMYGIRLRKG